MVVVSNIEAQKKSSLSKFVFSVFTNLAHYLLIWLLLSNFITTQVSAQNVWGTSCVWMSVLLEEIFWRLQLS